MWCVISLTCGVTIGLVGRALFPTALLTSSDAENIFVILSQNLLPPLAAGIVMAGILAATISSSDSYLLIAASAFAMLLAISAVGIVIALDENSVIFSLVAFAWAGFGATFGPIMLASLFWKRTTWKGAVAGMVSGAVMVFVWKNLISPLGGLFGIYELLPAFLVSLVVIVVVSLLDKEPSAEIQEAFELAKKRRPRGGKLIDDA